MKATITILPAGNSAKHNPATAAYALKIYEAGKGSTERWLCHNWQALGGDASICDARVSTQVGTIYQAAQRATQLAKALAKCEVSTKPVISRVLAACAAADIAVRRACEESRHARALLELATLAGEETAAAESELARAEAEVRSSRADFKLAVEQAALAEWRRHEESDEA